VTNEKADRFLVTNEKADRFLVTNEKADRFLMTNGGADIPRFYTKSWIIFHPFIVSVSDQLNSQIG